MGRTGWLGERLTVRGGRYFTVESTKEKMLRKAEPSSWKSVRLPFSVAYEFAVLRECGNPYSIDFDYWCTAHYDAFSSISTTFNESIATGLFSGRRD
jgi:hypothetical protein